MRNDFQNIARTRDDKGALMVRWNDGKVEMFAGPEKDRFMKPYREYLSQQEIPLDRICDLDTVDENGHWSRNIEVENMRSMMGTKEKEKHIRMEDNFNGVCHLMNSITTLQNKSQTYADEIVNFQKNTIKAMQDSESFLMKENVTKWELKRLESLIKFTTECREISKKINAVTLQIMEDWII